VGIIKEIIDSQGYHEAQFKIACVRVYSAKRIHVLDALQQRARGATQKNGRSAVRTESLLG